MCLMLEPLWVCSNHITMLALAGPSRILNMVLDDIELTLHFSQPCVAINVALPGSDARISSDAWDSQAPASKAILKTTAPDYPAKKVSRFQREVYGMVKGKVRTRRS